MSGEKDLQKLLKSMKPELNEGEFVFCKIETLDTLNLNDIEMLFREKEAITLILKKEKADELKLEYSVIMSWITLSVHSSLEAIGLTAAFSNALSQKGISCNVVAAFYHDHIFVNKKKQKKRWRFLVCFQTDYRNLYPNEIFEIPVFNSLLEASRSVRPARYL